MKKIKAEEYMNYGKTITKELTPLEALEFIKQAPTIYCGCGSDVYTRNPHECKIIEKALKALEIIKRYVQLEDDKVYTIGWEWNLTQEEYNLLKEILDEGKTNS